MIVLEIMTTHLVTVEPDDTLSHAANLLRQHQFHHLPAVRLPAGRMVPLAKTLLAADDLHVNIGSLLLLPGEDHYPQNASLHLNTINPGPLLTRLQQEGVQFCSGDSPVIPL